LPGVAGQGIVLDLDAGDIDKDGDRDVVLTRTGSDNFYVGYYIQVVVNNGDRQFTDDTTNRITIGTGANWIDWIRLQDKNDDQFADIVVDDAARNLIWWNDGTGKFNTN